MKYYLVGDEQQLERRIDLSGVRRSWAETLSRGASVGVAGGSLLSGVGSGVGAVVGAVGSGLGRVFGFTPNPERAFWNVRIMFREIMRGIGAVTQNVSGTGDSYEFEVMGSYTLDDLNAILRNVQRDASAAASTVEEQAFAEVLSTLRFSRSPARHWIFVVPVRAADPVVQVQQQEGKKTVNPESEALKLPVVGGVLGVLGLILFK